MQFKQKTPTENVQKFLMINNHNFNLRKLLFKNIFNKKAKN